MRRAIAIDFDGCICRSKYPEIGEPNWHVIEEAKKEQAAGAGLILWTCRAGKELDAAITACKEWGLNFDAVNQSLPEWIEAWGSDLPDKKYTAIYADPPWSYRQCGTGPKSRGNAAQHYNTMTTDDICALPVKNLAGGGRCASCGRHSHR